MDSQKPRAGVFVDDEGSQPPRNLSYKPWLDRGIILAAHIVLFPVFAIIWLLVPLAILLDDGGPVLFVQSRAGRSGAPFNALKFRTMTISSERSGVSFTRNHDPRVTRVGGFLRRTALDELPQVINIWRGEMSLVGPRALPWDMHQAYLAETPEFARRYEVPPGLTGLAALQLPRHCTAEERLTEDLRYIASASFLLDVKLIALSVVLTLTGQWGKGRRKIAQDADSTPVDK